MIFTSSFPRITSDFAGVFCQLSRMARSSIRRESSRLNNTRETGQPIGFVRCAEFIDGQDSRLRGNDVVIGLTDNPA